MTATEPTPFSLRDPLPPPGVTLLEASAGTGKTYTIAALATRYVAEGTPLSDLLVITFTRAATSELRERVRSRLLDAHASLGRYSADGSWDHKDTLIEVLIRGQASQISARMARLGQALSDFDTATITTTHGFCLDALAQLGLAGDCELDPAMVPEVADLVDQVTFDQYVAAFHDTESPLRSGEAIKIARDVNTHPYAAIEPVDDPSLPPSVRQRIAFAHAARAEIARRKRLAGVMTFDDLQMRLRDAVADPGRGPAAIAILRRRYSVVLVDEFQDTDTVQWDVLQRTFGGAGSTLLLIGDPKQAIYAFRGADVYAYLAAGAQAGDHWTLATNFRSDQSLLTGLDAVFGSLELGDPHIKYRPVTAADQSRKGLTSPLRFRVLAADAHVSRTGKGLVQKDSGNDFIAADVAVDIVSKLEAGVAVPQDIAVLVDKHKEARLIQRKLLDSGVPAVIRGNASVFATPAAMAWQRLLECLDQPNNSPAVRRLAASEFLGWSANTIAEAGDDAWAGLHRDVSRWGDVFDDHGVAAVFEAVADECELRPRLLQAPNGERDLTDLQHVAELLNSQAVHTQPSAGTLMAWLHQRIKDTSTTDFDERTRRLDTDADAVQVVTIHAAKGLEFAIVYCPFLWNAPWFPDSATQLFHRDGARIIDVGGKDSPTTKKAQAAHREEELGEDLRLAYVAMTRAQHELVIWWADAHNGKASPLSRILCGENAASDAVTDRITALPDVTATISVEALTERPTAVPITLGPVVASGTLAVNEFDRQLDETWRRTSFSGITRRIHEARVGGEVHAGLTTDEHDTESAEHDEADDVLRERGLLWSQIPAGARTGTFVHAVLENIDFTAGDLHGELSDEITRQLRWRNLPGADPEVLAAGLGAAIDTPFDPSRSNVRLRDITPAHRVNEMDFEFAIANNALPRAAVTLDAIADLLRSHTTASDPLHGYPDKLADPSLNTRFRGFLSGSIDLLLRLPDTAEGQQFSVVDYKTNRRGGPDGSAWDYRPEALRQAVFDAHYPLQFLIYTIAAHRYLRGRLPNYDPARHIGPVKYLFLRGMLGADGPRVGGQACGVFTWQPTPELICDLSDLFDQGVGA